MINLEQVKLLEAKVSKAIGYVERLSSENTVLLQKEAEMQTRLESYQKRIDELEILILQFKEDQGRIEDSILAALDRLSQFENAIEKSLKNRKEKIAAPKKQTAPLDPPQPEVSAGQPVDEKVHFEISEAEPADDVEDPLDGEQPPDEDQELDIF